MSKLYQDIKNAVKNGKLKEPFRTKNVKTACSRWSLIVIAVFLPKHRKNNPGGYIEYFWQIGRGLYKLL